MAIVATTQRTFRVLVLQTAAGLERAIAADLEAAFVLRARELTGQGGRIGVCSSPAGFFQATMRPWREGLRLAERQPVLLAEAGRGIPGTPVEEMVASIFER